MRRTLLAVSCLALVLAVGLIAGASLGIAQPSQPVESARPTPTPILPLPEKEPASPESPEALPDLIVESIRVDPPNPYVEQNATVYVTIMNVGDADVEPGNNTFLDLYINPTTDDLRGIPGDYWWGVQGAPLKVNQSVVYSIILTQTFTDTVSYNLWAQVDTPYLPSPPDPWGWVLEGSEDNNILGPEPIMARTHYSWVQKDHVDFFSNMASTLDVVPIAGTVGIITNTPGLEVNGDSALALGVFEEPPLETWGLSSNTDDYNMLYPDTQLNEVETYDQRFPYVYAEDNFVVAVWEDSQNGPTYGRDIFLSWSDSEGIQGSWEPPIQVNETYNGNDLNDQKHPAVAVSPDGTIVVVWQDSRDGNFDIYVQALKYNGSTVEFCQSNGDCSTPCNPATQECNFRVDTGAGSQDQILPDIAVDDYNNFYVVWQDQRNGNDDIFAVRSYTSTVECVSNRAIVGFAPQPSPDQIRAPEQVYLCWANDRRIHDDPSNTRQASPSVSALSGTKIEQILTEVIFHPPPEPPSLIVTGIEVTETAYIAVTWEDWREGDPDIYFTSSDDLGASWRVDVRLNDDKPPNSSNGVQQRAPDVAINQWMKLFTLTKEVPPYGTASGTAELPVTTMHIVWQDYRNSTPPTSNNNSDVYYQRITVEPQTEDPWPVAFTHEGEQKVNENDNRAWQSGPVSQVEPSVAASSTGQTLAESEGYNALIVWADGRNYGGEFENIDIYFRWFTNVGEPATFVGENNIGVNDGARLHDFDAITYDMYRVDVPPHARQRNPSIASTLVANWPYISGGWVYVVWDDDRISDPFYDRNIYLARSRLVYGGNGDIYTAPAGAPPDTPGQGEAYGAGAFVSEIFDSRWKDTTWYIVDWHAVTQSGTYITLQTRLGNTREEVLASDWLPERFPYPDDPGGGAKGSPLQGYDAPGQHIEDAGENYWPQARFIQYRVNFWARDTATDPDLTVLETPFLFDVILHYERPPGVFLPLVLTNYH
jgi:hypothetical protein